MPSVVYPFDNSMDIRTVGCVLNWSCIDPDGDTDLVYDFYFGKNPNPVLLVEDTMDSEYKIGFDLDLDTVYYWRVDVTDSFGASSSGDVWCFKTSSIPPPPVFGSIGISFPKRLCWGGVKASIMNTGGRDCSNVYWSVSVSGGLFDQVDMVESGCFNVLNSSESREFSTYEFLDFGSNILGVGRVKVKIQITDVDDSLVSTRSKDAVAIGPILIFLE
jgi:hypothetical protein